MSLSLVRFFENCRLRGQAYPKSVGYRH